MDALFVIGIIALSVAIVRVAEHLSSYTRRRRYWFKKKGEFR